MKFEEALAYMRRGGYVKLSCLRDCDAVTIEDGNIPSSLLSSEVIVEGNFEYVVPTFGFIKAIKSTMSGKIVSRKAWGAHLTLREKDGYLDILPGLDHSETIPLVASDMLADDWYEVIE